MIQVNQSKNYPRYILYYKNKKNIVEKKKGVEEDARVGSKKRQYIYIYIYISQRAFSKENFPSIRCIFYDLPPCMGGTYISAVEKADRQAWECLSEL